ncbi:hypothetical protein [Caloranaerobacter azorensis]|uniref:Uncharacterized protein n=1 Tax=Caloranaerobacter azorensis TaxID=116090 RepID=A0A6P1YD10_9FIRM|nr:hypothetical protein [Caloranaerobacter azorensis]QIB26065.1 hypothetical protein G3A45_01315 [Caloranaerobacter azorensis]
MSQSLDRVDIKISVNTKLDGEFDELLFSVDTCNYKEVKNGEVIFYIDFRSDVADAKKDIEKVLDKAKEIQKVYKNVKYPYEAIEILLKKRKGA